MSNNTPTSNRIHIAFFGKRNAGKSSLVNAITNQELSVVSDIKGTTTDPVQKSMELLPLGPVVIIDTPGYDDTGILGEKRVLKTKQVLNKADIAILVSDSTTELDEKDYELIDLFKEKNINYIVAHNKCDMLNSLPQSKNNEIFVSAKNNINITELKDMIGKVVPVENDAKFVKDLVGKDEIIVFVIPIDEAAPKGRIILPQQMAIRDALDSNAISVAVQTDELESVISLLGSKIKMVVTDSQVFHIVNKIVPDSIALTSFSILMARYKGLLDSAVRGASMLENLNNGDTVLISEGCTHHRQCNDIGTVKMPRWIENYTGKKLNFEFSSGAGFPDDLNKYSLIVHCGGCMLTDREIKYRVKCATDMNIPITNYGITIAYMNGILKRCLSFDIDLQSKIK